MWAAIINGACAGIIGYCLASLNCTLMSWQSWVVLVFFLIAIVNSMRSN